MQEIGLFVDVESLNRCWMMQYHEPGDDDDVQSDVKEGTKGESVGKG